MLNGLELIGQFRYAALLFWDTLHKISSVNGHEWCEYLIRYLQSIVSIPIIPIDNCTLISHGESERE